MGWRRANRIRPPIGTQLRLGQPALERRRLSPNTSAAGCFAGASLALRATMQRIAAALATRSIGLVDVAPVGIELFAISAELPPRPALSSDATLALGNANKGKFFSADSQHFFMFEPIFLP